VFAFSVFCVVLAFIGSQKESWGFREFTLFIMGLLFAPLAAITAIVTQTCKVRLWPTAIEVCTRFGAQRLELKDIGARRLVVGEEGSHICLYPTNPDETPLTITTAIHRDEYFEKWLSAIPEADASFLGQRSKAFYRRVRRFLLRRT
jgi:hypothetical protein